MPYNYQRSKQNNENSNKQIDGNVAWDARQRFPLLVMDIIWEMYMFKCDGDLDKYKVAFKQVYSLTKPYIQKHLSAEDKTLFKFDDLTKLEENIVSDPTETQVAKNIETQNKVLEALELKEERLYALLALEGFLLPINAKSDLGKSVMQTN